MAGISQASDFQAPDSLLITGLHLRQEEVLPRPPGSSGVTRDESNLSIGQSVGSKPGKHLVPEEGAGGGVNLLSESKDHLLGIP